MVRSFGKLRQLFTSFNKYTDKSMEIITDYVLKIWTVFEVIKKFAEPN